MRASRSALAISGVVLASGLIAMSNPTVARATSNAISSVLVTNTAANPVQVAAANPVPVTGSVSVSATNPVPVTTSGTVSVTAASPVPITTSGPLVTQSVGQQAAQMVVLSCDVSLGQQDHACNSVPSYTSFTTPADKALVITSVDINLGDTVSATNACDGYGEQAELRVNGTAVLRWFNLDIHPNHFAYPSGIALPVGSQFTVDGGSPCGFVEVVLTGYLTAN